MTENPDLSKDPIESLNNFINGNFPNALIGEKIIIKGENAIIAIHDLEINLINDLFKKIPKELIVKYDELEGRIEFSKKNAAELFNFLMATHKQSTTRKPNILHSFTQQTESESSEPLDHDRKKREQDEKVQLLMEYSNVPRKNLYTTDHEQTPQFMAKHTEQNMTKFTLSLDHYANHELKNPNSHGHLGGLIGSDQAYKKHIAQEISQKLKAFSKISISDPNYSEFKKNIMKEIESAINKNRKAHGFWASLSGPGKLEKLLIGVKNTIEPENSNKRRLQH